MSSGYVKPKKINELIAEQLTIQIKNGEIGPGERLASVPQLAEQFQVGRSAIREALSALKAVGLIDIRQGEGSFVKKVDHDIAKFIIPTAQFMKNEDIRQLFEIRKIVETGAASLAAIKREQADLDKLEQTLVQMETALGDGELGELADIQFHHSVVVATKNKMLESFLQTVSETMKSVMHEARAMFFYGEQAKLHHLYQEHCAIYEAIKEQDQSLAYETMMTHIVGVEKALFAKGW